jgi:predicted metal-dependent phosphoesterase TrpH
MVMNSSTTGLSLAADAAIDLHLHTIHSDGAWTPEGLLDYLVGEQFDLVAITDHDRADTTLALQQLAQAKHLPVLVAVEMTASWRGEMTDLLCFGFDPTHSALHELAQDLLRRQQDNTREVYENLQNKGYALPQSPSALAGLLAQPSAQQPHALVALLKSQGYGQGEPSAGKIAFEAGCAFATNDLAAVVEAAQRSRAVCLIAHPGHTDGFVTYDVRLLDEVRQEAPLDGLEVYHRRHTPAQTAMYLEYARRHHLLTSAGSDSHSPDKPPIKYQAELCRALLERLGIQMK